MEENDGTPSPQPRTHFRVDVVVREVCTDGSIADDDLRFVRFGEELSSGGIRDFFDRAGLALSTMFPTGVQLLALSSIGPNKIQLIKAVREITGLGLKDAKDLVEAPLNEPRLVVDDGPAANEARRRLESTGASIRFVAYHVKYAGLPVVRFE